ncbi:Tetratricopeptide-like helical [Penicillium macrosclerotiorum]|uniref:Tetratricopeptide-like helical n=1 Tax=Penicillium macrosclerotiorum TaxID=303699 RepID=UPI0025472780|nr:Tetratricopeptide-like helical [Penicillium macrosclerotiorum]KAJ5689571.1 Tetratricopeptide-like helical [Penicillium macrosclerotiorum]
MPFTHHDYTVAWICALPLEMTAAKMVLDEVHPDLSQSKSDHNAYTLGSVSGHNVVVACLPSGVYGTTSAAVVLAHTLETFPALRFGLMVGIGGGVPSKNADIRLGDVVVSMPTATSGGVIQYDYGKTIRDGCFERTRSLNKPPQYVLTAISQIRSDALDGTTLTDENTSEALQRHPNHQKRFSRPDVDWLFRADYNHSGKNADCSECDQCQLVTRPSREANEPVIHYGLIASGNQVMKDAIQRDAIAQELDILCFEMEAAGIMDQLPCLVIRGVCDYCDSHKNEKWQGYAALTAASYARALLRVVPLYSHSHNLHRKERHHWMIPFARNPRFVGRQQEIDRLEKLISNTSGPTKIAIHGLGGIGKTQIALELAYSIRQKFPECSIFWIPCISYESVEQSYLTIASALGISTTEPAKAKEQVKFHLSQESAGKWLLIFDNADDMEMWIKGSTTAPPLKNLLPRSGNGHILFTSRNRKLAVKIAALNVLSIPDVDQSTAMDILERSVIQTDLLYDQNGANTLLEQLSFLPLAISQAAAYVNENNISLSQYLALLKEKEISAAEILSEEFEDDGRYAETQNPVITTWLISFQQIQQLDSLAIDYLSFIACINPRDIPQSILPPAPSTKKRVDALGLLKAYSFISEHAYTGSFSLHRLVHLAMRNWMRKTKIIDRWVHRVAQQLDELFPDDDHNNRELWREYLSHALYLTNSEEFHQFRLEYVGFTSRVARSLENDGRYDEANHLLTGNLNDSEKALGLEHPNTLGSVDHLGSVLAQQGKYKEAEAMHRRALEGCEKAVGIKHPHTLKSLSHLGFVLAQQGKYEEAEALHRRALEGRERALGIEHPDTIASVGHISFALTQQGKYEEAEAIHRRVLEGCEKALGIKHPHTLKSLSHLGFVLAQQGKYKEAEAMHRRALEGCEKALGLEHPDTLTSVSYLGFALAPQGKFEEAEAMHRRALEGRGRALGLEHPDTLASAGHVSFVLALQGKHEESEAIHRRVLKGRETALGLEHPDTLASVNNLGLLLERQGKYEESEAMHRRALEGYKKTLGLEHPYTLTSLKDLGSVLAHQGKYKEIEAMHRKALEGSEKPLGLEHLDTLATDSNLAHSHESLEPVQDVSAAPSGQAFPILAGSQDRSGTAAQRSLGYYTLFGSSQSTHAVPRHCDMDEVD